MSRSRSAVMAILAAVTVVVGVSVVAAPAASADTCRQSAFGSTDILGNPRYNCSDGNSYTLRRPFGANSWNDPMTTYQLRPNYGYGSRNGSDLSCRYSTLTGRYNCR